MKVLSLFFNFLLTVSAFADLPDYEKSAAFICSTPLNGKSFVYADYFSPKFVKAVPEQYFLEIIQNVVTSTGKCKTYSKVLVSSQGARYNFLSPSNDYSVLDFHLNEKGLIDSLLVHDVVLSNVVIKSWSDINQYAQTLPGEVSVTIKSDSGKFDNRLGNNLHPLGSGFKLYVLGTVIDSVKNGTLKWSDSFPIKKEWKSLPSGKMQTWQDGTLVSIQQYAEYMIKISDNTATDHLINILGREKVEQQLKTMGNDFIPKNLPFLSTAEMFKIKWAAPTSLIDQFVNGTETIKRELLNQKISSIPLAQVGTNGVPTETPSFITDIEWFGSTNSLCTAMSSLQSKGSSEAMSILSKNAPFIDPGATSFWEFGGFKGGSEPGVRTMTYLLKSKSQHWGCVSIAWHNTQNNINHWTMYDLVRKTLKVAESYF